MKPFVLIVIACVLFCRVDVKADDSIPAHQLDELIVHGDRSWIENGIINFIPSKSEKKLSNSPATLVKSMHLPFLKEKDGFIVNMAGEIVPVFINGEKADDIDLATFWPKEVRRVQYLTNPADPCYEGVKVAVNFIMPKYEAGGVSKIDLFQKIPNFGYYTASSKLVYKKMTYGFLCYGNYSRDHRSGMSGETQYRDLFYDHEKYGLISNTENTHSFNREEAVNCAFNAKYLTDKVLISHTVSLGWNRNPGSGSHGESAWSENLFKASGTSSYSESKSISPQIAGKYVFALPRKWFLTTNWQYSYARNDNFSSSQTGLANPVENSIFEDVNSLKFRIQPSIRPSKKWIVQLKAECGLDWYSTHYTGSANTRQNQSRQDVSFSADAYWIPSEALTLSLEPGVSASFWQIGSVSQHMLTPTINAGIRWNPISKFSIDGSMRFVKIPASASESNPVLVRTSELLWLKGNPYLKSLTASDTYIMTTYLPKNWLTISFGIGYVRTSNGIIYTYAPAPSEAGGLIKEMINAKPTDRVRANIGFRGSFFDDNLSIDITPLWDYAYVRGAYKGSFNHLSVMGSADYTMGDFRVELLYEGPVKHLDMDGMEKSWRQGHWDTSLVYGNGNWYVSFRIQNIFNNKQKSWTHFTSPNYVSKYNYFETGRTFAVNLTYTFGYGKKVDTNIDVNGPESAKTSIM